MVTVGPFEDTLAAEVNVPDLTWTNGPVEGELTVQCSAHGARRPARVVGTTIRWIEPQPRVAAGQSVVLYVDDDVVGGGVAG